ncbi:ABC transporter ATP-binding protein [Paenibacillus dauci]|uniref:ABC transporter ATP-binding protein n=1 Tax=Paenibacillus dauci TaxID=1567106 RepID=UPI000619AB01|nr:ABC transporter ATP-binding protein [Paenibacillus dauci]
MNAIELQGIQVNMGRKRILKGIDLTIEQGDFMTFLGPSGCGKTTLLRTIAGLQKADGGTIVLNGREVANGETAYHMDPAKRGLSLVFQSYALWPHMSVYENVAFGLQVRRQSKTEIREKVMAALTKVRIADLSERYPGELSGGQQQRVAIARAIVTEPQVLLLDEPLSNLDARLRVEMRAELKRLHRELGATIIYVTHDQQEALTLSTRIAVFFEGEIVQLDRPQTLYQRPATLQVADFFGNGGMDTNHLSAELIATDGGRSYLSSPVCSFPLEGITLTETMPVILTIKPEHIQLHRSYVPQSVPSVVEAVFPAGAETLVKLMTEGSELSARVLGDAEYSCGETVYITLNPEHMNLYNQGSGVRLPGVRPITPTREMIRA